MMGLLGLGLAWRRGINEFALPPALADALMGAVTILGLFAVLTYVVKFMRRPGVVLEDLKILPGRTGLAAGVLCIYLLAAAFGPYAPEQARPILLAGIGVHLALSFAVIWVFATGPAAQRRVSPAWHLLFSGWIVAAMVAQGLGLVQLGVVLFWGALVAAVAIWSISLGQLARETVPAPLRPLLAIHLSPAALLTTVAQGFGATGMAQSFAILTAVILAVLVVRGRWLLAGEFSPMWGALTFPLAATATAWLSVGGLWRLPGGFVLIAATLMIPPIAFKIFKLWAKGQLAVKTNAAVA
jgi:tellurite resistance protein